VSKDDIDANVLARAVADQLRSRDRAIAALGYKILEVRPGFARVGMVVRTDMLNGHDIIHGGLVFALADTALAYAANSHDTLSVTQQASIIFLSPAKEGESLIAEAVERAVVGRSGVYDVSVNSADGRAIATLHGLTRGTSQSVIPK